MTKAISQIANRKLGYGLTVFIFITIIFNYFEIYYHYWFLKLVNGYVIKIWLLPVLLFCFLLFKELLAKGYSFPLKAVSGVNLFIVFYVLFGFISLTVHEQPYYIGKYALIMFAPLTLYAVIVDSFRDNKNIEKVLNLLFIAGLILSLYVSYMFYILGPEKWSSENIEVKYMLTDVSAVRNLKESFNIQNFGYGNLAIRKTLIGIAEPTFGAMLAPLILIGFYYTVNSTGLLRLFYYISSFFMFYTLTNTLARASFVAFIIGLIPFFVHIRKRIKDILIILIGIAIIISANQPMQYRIIQLIGSTAQKVIDKSSTAQKVIDKVKTKIEFSGDGHIDSLNETLRNFKEAPFLGNGISNIEGKYKNDRWYAEHNRYLYILSTAGLLTLIPYVAFILGLIIIARKTFLNKLKSNRSIQDIGLVLYPSVLLFAIQINNAGMETYYYWIFFGLAAAWIRNSKSEDRNENSIN